jgi:hypothetical protein
MDLLNAISTFLRHLMVAREKMNVRHGRVEDFFEMKLAGEGYVTHEALEEGGRAHMIYHDLEEALRGAAVYEPLYMNDFMDGQSKHRFVNCLKLFAPVQVCRHPTGNYFGDAFFIWRIPTETFERDVVGGSVLAMAAASKMVPTFHSRAMRRAFMTKFGLVKGVDKVTLRATYAAMTGDASAARISAEAQMDGRMRLYLESDGDPEL